MASLSSSLPKFTIPAPPAIRFSSSQSSKLSIASFRQWPNPLQLSSDFHSRVFAVTSDDEWGDDPPEDAFSAASTVNTVEKPGEESGSSVQDLKRALVDKLVGTDRGMKASRHVRAEIAELICQLEAQNPTPAPTEALSLLDGKWILVYTSFSKLFPLTVGMLPLVTVGEISELIDSNTLSVENSVSFKSPFATQSFSTGASFEIQSPKRLKIKFVEGVIGTPQLSDKIEIPEDIQFIGQKIDLRPAQGFLRPFLNAASSVARTISGHRPVKFPIRIDKAQSWLITTYLDEDLRVSRGDGGNIFVLIKERSSLLADL